MFDTLAAVLDARDEAQAYSGDFAAAIAGLVLVIRALPHCDVRNLTVILPAEASKRQLQRLQPVKAAILDSLERVTCLRQASRELSSSPSQSPNPVHHISCLSTPLWLSLLVAPFSRLLHKHKLLHSSACSACRWMFNKASAELEGMSSLIERHLLSSKV